MINYTIISQADTNTLQLISDIPDYDYSFKGKIYDICHIYGFSDTVLSNLEIMQLYSDL